MVFLLCCIVCAVFSLFFYAIDMWYFGILPLFFLVFMGVQGVQTHTPTFKIDEVWYKYSLVLIWLLILVGLSGVLFFIGISEIVVYLCLLFLNIFLLIGSYVFDYTDGKRVFEL
ncbi:MAG: hypothetical protein LBG52_06760 [Candidatus Peribacteria bacterium]|jgi:hypothetical protein|nr:hypothetical protein [Candidatus Peribacteria bacterium]